MVNSRKRLKQLMDCETVKLGEGSLDRPLNFIFRLSPVPKGRNRMGHTKSGGVFMTRPTRTRNYEALIAEATALQYPLQSPLTCELIVFINFYMENRRHGDIDNLAKSVLDGMQGVAFANDKQIKGLHMEIFFCNEEPCGVPRTEVILSKRTPPTSYEGDSNDSSST